jgi:hypothetical protein
LVAKGLLADIEGRAPIEREEHRATSIYPVLATTAWLLRGCWLIGREEHRTTSIYPVPAKA